MSRDIDSAYSDDGAAYGKKKGNDKNCENISRCFATTTDLITLPVDVFRCDYFLIFDEEIILFLEFELLRNIVNAAATVIPHASMTAGKKAVVTVEISQTFYL